MSEKIMNSENKFLYDILEFYLVNFHFLNKVISISHGMIISKKNVNIGRTY